MIDRMEVLRLYRQVEKWLQERNFDKIEQFLQNLDFENQSTLLLVGSLRVTFCVKEKIPSWEDTLFSVRKELKRRKCDVNVILQGLADENEKNS